MNTKNRNPLSLLGFVATMGFLLLGSYASANIDGDLSEWNIHEQINMPYLPPALDDGDKLYGKYAGEAYVFALHTTGAVIGPNTTFWLNTDNNASTGYLVWGAWSGAEFYVEINASNVPNLYEINLNGTDLNSTELNSTLVSDVEFSYNTEGTVLEFVVPAPVIGSPSNGISVMADINDNVFLPDPYSDVQFTILNESVVLPPRTDFSKRVGIVYSETSKLNFYDKDLENTKAYSQLFMSTQHQAMMAGIPFDLLTEDDLTDISKLVNYDALIFPYFAHVPSDKLEQIHSALFHAVYHYGIGIITAGDWMAKDSDDIAIDGNSYRFMNQILGIARVDGEGPVEITVTAKDVTHPSMKTYTTGEVIYPYPNNNHWYNYFDGVTNSSSETQPISVLAEQNVIDVNDIDVNSTGTYNSVLAIEPGEPGEAGARHVHFSSIEFMGDTNLLWTALQWSVYGDKNPVALKMGRHNNLFVSRNDMDQSQEIEEVEANGGALLPILEGWKTDYNFVGSYFINIGNNPNQGQDTNWSYSGPLYRDYINLGNEMGNHSYTHPDDTNILTPAEIEFQFNDAMDIIGENINPTWRDQNIRGCAVPGAPEGLDTAQEIIQYQDYLTGGYASVGSGYPGAFGYLTPTTEKVYFSPNMSFDFTMIAFGVPVWDEEQGIYVSVPLSAEEAEAYWLNEYQTLMNHASQPIIHWPWHDYGPTTGVDGLVESIGTVYYSVEMYTSTISNAFNDNAEFLTSIDAAQRIAAFKDVNLTVDANGDSITVNVESSQVGKFALDINSTVTGGKVIQSVDDWYAYNEKSVFLPQDGGDFTITLGTEADDVTHITALPMRAALLSLNGDGNLLDFSFKGEGSVWLTLNQHEETYIFTGADEVNRVDDSTVELKFNSFGVHNVTMQFNRVKPPTPVGEPIPLSL